MKKRSFTDLIIVLFFLPLTAGGQSIVGSRHNLSVSGTGNVKAMTETDICKFCHITHSSRSHAPLWNVKKSGATYTLYHSSTLDAEPGQPDGSSILCLSCHDGTIALGNVSSSGREISFSSRMKKGNLGTDLSDDHPISFAYNAALAGIDPEIKNPSALPRDVRLEKEKVQCISCHDPHKNLTNNFLPVTAEFSELCLKCHDKAYWETATHKTSPKTWNGNPPDPWKHIEYPYAKVSQNGCENCHDMHNAAGKERLLKSQHEEDNCLDCHNGNASSANIQAEFTKTYKHNIYAYTAVHDPAEKALVKTKHVECMDCHNPHAANDAAAKAPYAKGSMEGLKGVNQNGLEVYPAQYEYEVCFRCHSDDPAVPRFTTRYLGTGNTRLDFASTNISYHPVIAPSKNTSPVSLKVPYTYSQMIYCSDCHASDGKGASDGPHGSSIPRILKLNYNLSKMPQLGTGWPTLIYSNFTLCFQCHELSAVTDIHSRIKEGHFMKYMGCNGCHDPHGYPGGTPSSNRFLLNFDVSVIQPNPANGKTIDLNTRKCYMVCHDAGNVVNYTHDSNGSGF